MPLRGRKNESSRLTGQEHADKISQLFIKSSHVTHVDNHSHSYLHYFSDVAAFFFFLDNSGGRNDSWPAAQSLGRVFMSLPVMTSIIDQ